MNTDIISVFPETDVETLLRLMREHELPGVPVIDHSNKVIGIVTDADLVIRDPLTVRPDDTPRHAAKLIAEHHHNRLPVTGPEGELVGMVTRVDVLGALTRES